MPSSTEYIDVFGLRTRTPRGDSVRTVSATGSSGTFTVEAFFFAAFFLAAFSSAAFNFAAFLSVTSSLPVAFLELDPRRNTIALLNLSLLELPIHAADRFIGRGLNDFDTAQVF